jgi:hypothetical protein
VESNTAVDEAEDVNTQMAALECKMEQEKLWVVNHE